ncbi:hypothetical protein [Paenibacillus macquariensis]|uniref:Uncharacterized protein n=1 Tax=Paenibacillus macquariensis TaxID=948756 RepID=A0ABY1JNL9_9BACL|nr:hypothetical protein [Paenibacillus macquariensis]MEC0092158.1 hypothetical protein [Paenibacillus macquariensis]OAB37289.1 hypothetical protein PMSM_04235 [Paenibacillus macquariensis subsp. macquariensis]SIQ49997.1 hypothetical protein SAMN05421578_102271 [Paenibacillus macquariensis]
MKKTVSFLCIMLAIVLSFTTTAFAAFNYSSPSYTISSGTIKFGNGVIVNTGKYRDDLTIRLYQGTKLVSTKTITLNPQESIYPGAVSTPLITLATNQPAGDYSYTLSSSGSWHVMASLAI